MEKVIEVGGGVGGSPNNTMLQHYYGEVGLKSEK